MSAGSPRIMPYNSCARKTSVSQDKINKEKIVDDSNDYLETEEYAFFVTREKISESYFLVRTLNRAKLAGIFDFFLEVLSNTEPYPSFDQIFSIISFVGNASAMFHKRYAKYYIPKFNDIAMKCLVDSPQSNYCNLNKEKFNSILFYLKSLLKRVFSIEVKNDQMYHFSLEFSMCSFQSPYLDRKIEGLQGISGAISLIVELLTLKDFHKRELVELVKVYKIIEEVFGPKSDFQLVQQLREIIFLSILHQRTFQGAAGVHMAEYTG